MNLSPEPDRDYLEALRRCARVPIFLHLEVVTVFRLVAILQLALRHPAATGEFEATATAAREFIEDFRQQIATQEPRLAELVAMGNRPDNAGMSDADPSFPAAAAIAAAYAAADRAVSIQVDQDVLHPGTALAVLHLVAEELSRGEAARRLTPHLTEAAAAAKLPRSDQGGADWP